MLAFFPRLAFLSSIAASAGIIQVVSFSLFEEVLHLPYWPSYLIALTLSVLWNFTFNRKYTFKSANNVPKAMFQDMMDRLFDDTKKKIDRKSNEIQFFQNGDTLTPYQLSSGEKQMLVILLTVLVEDGEPHALIMDEPEVSLHIEWQQQLISLIRQLNPKAQVIMSTHAPALIMDGWQDCVIEVEEITNPD